MPNSFGHFQNQSWKLKAKCQDTPFPDAWFGKADSTLKAKRLCAGCIVSSQCLAYALENEEPWGIWGGMTTGERKRLKRKMNKFLSRLERRETGQSQDVVEHPTAS
jgi:WhiB family transcriptional regulator, redox-sensing transcriptional regulator